MKLQQQIIDQLSVFPNSSFAQLAVAFHTENRYTLSSTLDRMYDAGEIARILRSGNYVYSVVERIDLASQPAEALTEIQKLELQVNRLIQQGYYRRAGTLYLELIKKSKSDPQRERFAALRRNCIQSANRPYEKQWYLAGEYVG
ncbi:hypothetical protein [Franconibacter helveticus]|uniref:hypothetical protein n=1 Tax=Franconibacter helveticus TaxID=357240 RepID=UPI000DA21C58|nr:hypothetical protein [Franconibacter helveticus]